MAKNTIPMGINVRKNKNVRALGYGKYYPEVDVKDTLSLRRSLRVQTAQAKLSARIVVVMPFILVAAFSLVSPDFLMPFFTSVFGYALLGLALVMQVAGIVLVRRALSVEGVA